MILSEHSVAQVSPDSNTLWTPQSLDTTGNTIPCASELLITSTIPAQAGLSISLLIKKKKNSTGEGRWCVTVIII